MQYVYGDDTSLLNAIAQVVARKKQQKSGKIASDDLTPEELEAAANNNNQNTSSSSVEESEDIPQNSNRLNVFLQASSQLCEDLLQEQANAKVASRRATRGGCGLVWASYAAAAGAVVMVVIVTACDPSVSTRTDLPVSPPPTLSLICCSCSCQPPATALLSSPPIQKIRPRSPLWRRPRVPVPGATTSWCSVVIRVRGAMSLYVCGRYLRYASVHCRLTYCCRLTPLWRMMRRI